MSLFLLAAVCAVAGPDTTQLVLKTTIYGNISPKSIVYAGNGYFFSQNMMYRHSITVYNRKHQLVKTISDRVKLKNDSTNQMSSYQGAPVEAVAVEGGQYVWVSNYRMYGDGYDNPGCDTCLGKEYDKSYIYKINTSTFRVDTLVEVGSVPKYLEATPDDKYILVSNWSSGDVSVVDNETNTEIKRVEVGKYPRGIAIDSKGHYAYVAVMGSWNIAVIDLQDNYKVSWIKGVGKSPRHLCVDSSDKYLYATLNGHSKVVKISLDSRLVVAEAVTGKAPRSMAISEDDQYLYVVNYRDASVSKVRTSDMTEMQRIKTNSKPIGITYDPEQKEVWACCYSGCIHIFKESDEVEEQVVEPPLVAIHEGNEGFHLIVGSFKSELNARRQLADLSRAGYHPEILKSSNGFYRVSIARYDNESDVDKNINAIKQKYTGAWLLIN